MRAAKGWSPSSSESINPQNNYIILLTNKKVKYFKKFNWWINSKIYNTIINTIRASFRYGQDTLIEGETEVFRALKYERFSTPESITVTKKGSYILK